MQTNPFSLRIFVADGDPDGLRIVEKGLAAGARVIVSGVQKVFFPGMPVDAKAVAMGAQAPAPTQAVAKN